MESQPQNPEFRNNPENFGPCAYYNLIFKYLTMGNFNVVDV